ncbi:pirin family protein [uncultured Maritimibacter sp.]|jgi:redox-sensitive bicupin YhaK (pirin superfamily)|uniref:pirin family protein n=1 Tax=uncultured Maritimibacter sp. TaxID=991866 RepID=UPI000ACD34DF|nr:pirin family protein [uncultured Maritimibacter sp.]
MSHFPGFDPTLATDPKSLEMVIVPRARDLGGFEVRRALPAAKRQMVGPFIFFDQMGPVEFIDNGIDVRPHPHIGLATVTYLYQGQFRHLDSLGSDRMITPGAVNWMVAGNGVTHSERSAPQDRVGRHDLFGIQTWVALPEDREDDPASFEHHAKADLPMIEGEGVTARLIVGRAWGEKAPASTFSDMFYGDVTLAPHATLPMPDDHEDRAFYVMDGEVEVASEVYAPHRMGIFRPGDRVALTAGPTGARVMVLGGETLNGPRYISWNFVASSREKLEAAQEAWMKGDFEHGRFALPPGDTEEFIPHPKARD